MVVRPRRQTPTGEGGGGARQREEDRLPGITPPSRARPFRPEIRGSLSLTLYIVTKPTDRERERERER